MAMILCYPIQISQQQSPAADFYACLGDRAEFLCRRMATRKAIQDPVTSRRCDVCNKTFVRSEHLDRHKRIHTNEKPFPCPLCEQAFQRSDVRALHVKKVHGVDFIAINLAKNDHFEPKRKRVKTACDLCRRRKLRCDGQIPCRQCRLGDSECQYSSSISVRTTQDLDLGFDSSNAELVVEDESSLLVDAGELLLNSSFALGKETTQSEASFPQVLVPESVSPGSRPTEGLMATPNPVSQPVHVVPDLDSTLMLQADIETNMLTDIWQVPLLSGEAWWEDLDFGSNSFTMAMHDLAADRVSPPSHNYSHLMQEYFDQRSRARCPSPNKAADMWYSAPASLWDHDLEILNVYINLFARNVPRFFRLFEDLTMTVETRPDYVLAVGAVGGLYCATPGSFEFSKAMYNDSRRLLLASTKAADWYTKNNPGYEEVMTIVKTYILNEMYGLSSGDKRSYEFVEVFHQDLAKGVQTLNALCTNASPSRRSEINRLKEALHILDCYRTCILQRPPSLLWQHLDSQEIQETVGTTPDDIRKLLMTTRGPSVVAESLENPSFGTLSTLSPFLWRVMPLAPAGVHQDEKLSKPDFVELVIDKWLRSHRNPVDRAAVILYHFMNIAIHTNLLLVQNYAHLTLSKECLDNEIDTYQASILRWVNSHHYQIAKWHAEKTLQCGEIEESLGSKQDPDSARLGETDQAAPAINAHLGSIDVAHVPYAVYYATLVLWCGSTSQDLATGVEKQSYLARGRSILLRHKLRIASLLERVLRQVGK